MEAEAALISAAHESPEKCRKVYSQRAGFPPGRESFGYTSDLLSQSWVLDTTLQLVHGRSNLSG